MKNEGMFVWSKLYNQNVQNGFQIVDWKCKLEIENWNDYWKWNWKFNWNFHSIFIFNSPFSLQLSFSNFKMLLNLDFPIQLDFFFKFQVSFNWWHRYKFNYPFASPPQWTILSSYNCHGKPCSNDSDKKAWLWSSLRSWI